jgi:4-hydroxybenzoate polyprenyltransferase
VHRSYQTIRDSFWASRPISWINTAAPFFLGYLLGIGRLDTTLWLGTLYFLIPYNLMLYGVNDIFDYESDIRNPRKGHLEGAVIAKARHKRLAWAIIVTNIPFILFFLAQGSLTSRLWFGFMIAMNLAYSLKGLRFKEIPLLDSFTSSTHFYSPLVYGLLLSGSGRLYWPALIGFVAWGMASHAFGAVQDIPFDREGHIASIATVFGVKNTLWFCTILYLIATIIPIVSYSGLGLLAGVILSLYAINSSLYLNLKDEQDAPRTNQGWKQFLWLNILNGFWITQLLLIAYNPFNLAPTAQGLALVILIGIGLTAFIFGLDQLIRARRKA